MLTSLHPYFNFSSSQAKLTVQPHRPYAKPGIPPAGTVRFNGIEDVDRLDIKHCPRPEDPKRKPFELERLLHIVLDSWGRDRCEQMQDIFSEFAFETHYHQLDHYGKRQVNLACRQIAKDYEANRDNRNVKPLADYLYYMKPHETRVVNAVHERKDDEALEHFRDWASLFDKPNVSNAAIETQFTKMKTAINRGYSVRIDKYRPSLLDALSEKAVVDAVHAQADERALRHFTG